MNAFVEALAVYWPTIVAALAGLVVGFFCYLKSRCKYKQALTEKETENIKLQEVIVEGSYIICPHCHQKIMMKDITIKTGGKIDEIKA